MSILNRARKLEEKTRMSILRQARKLEDKIQQRLQGAHIGEEPLEIWRGIAKEIEGQIQPVKGGYLFPHRQVAVMICPSSSEKKAALKAALDPSRLEEDIRLILQNCECDVPEDFIVTLRFAAKPGPEWNNPVFHLKYGRGKRPPSEEVAEVPVETPIRQAATLRITRGTAAATTYVIGKDVTMIGRGGGAATADASHTNDVVFEDSDDPINRSVSRKHARIVYDQDSGAYVLYDQSSLRGSAIVRGGRTAKLPGGSRGRRLLPGDQILLGKAVIEFE